MRRSSRRVWLAGTSGKKRRKLASHRLPIMLGGRTASGRILTSFSHICLFVSYLLRCTSRDAANVSAIVRHQ